MISNLKLASIDLAAFAVNIASKNSYNDQCRSVYQRLGIHKIVITNVVRLRKGRMPVLPSCNDLDGP